MAQWSAGVNGGCAIEIKMRLPVTIAYRTDTGRDRKENQDCISYICDERQSIHLLIVADGVGGAVCGHIASQLAVQTIRQSFFASEHLTVSPVVGMGERLAYAIGEANRMILHRGRRDRHCRGMGSTCAVLVLHNEQAFIAHAGDSRVYLIREDRIVQLTRDHSRVQRMLDDGLITEDEAVNHPDRNHLERALGLREEVQVDLRPVPLPIEENDRLLICTDGLTSLVWDMEIFAVVRGMAPDDACKKLIAMANERGGYDNISVGIALIGAGVGVGVWVAG